MYRFSPISSAWRRALREFGHDAAEAQVRSPDVIRKYTA
jgi:hypothetical protein